MATRDDDRVEVRRLFEEYHRTRDPQLRDALVEELPVGDPGVQTVLSATVLTVVLSVLAHGVTGRPLAGWFSRRPAGAIGRNGDR